jgi:heme/copper-type cytochrome/quinol oxidase subunit 2
MEKGETQVNALIDSFNAWILLLFVFLIVTVVFGFIWVKFSKKPALIEEEMSIPNRLMPKEKKKEKGKEDY